MGKESRKFINWKTSLKYNFKHTNKFALRIKFSLNMHINFKTFIKDVNFYN